MGFQDAMTVRIDMEAPPANSVLRSQFTPRHAGPRWQLLAGTLEGLEGRAALDMQRGLQSFLPYVLPVHTSPCENMDSLEHVAVIGTPATHPVIAGLIANGHLSSPTKPEGFSISLRDSPWRKGARLLAVAGADARGVLYGAQETCARIFPGGTLLDGFPARAAHLDTCPAFSTCENPGVRNRGIWTWGYVVRDYRRFLDHMLRLKLNTLTLWNDVAPLNAREVLDYAHAHGVSVLSGFHWGWGHEPSLDLSREDHRDLIRKTVLETYRTQYAGLDHDGIYFQTLTEHKNRSLAGKSTAHWACKLVNSTAKALLTEHPGLKLHFGLHGTSIGEDYADLKDLDPRVAIVWEDCGSLPYAYSAGDVAHFEETLELSKRLATFRPGSGFSLVPKGWMTLRWDKDFENHGPFLLGEQSPHFIRERLMARQGEWDVANEHWFRNHPLAARFYREILAVNPDVSATALVEDGGFEEAIQPSVALFAETVWNPALPDSERLARAMRPFYRWS